MAASPATATDCHTTGRLSGKVSIWQVPLVADAGTRTVHLAATVYDLQFGKTVRAFRLSLAYAASTHAFEWPGIIAVCITHTGLTPLPCYAN